MNTRARIENLCIHRQREPLLREVKRWIRHGSDDRKHSDGMEWLWRAGMIQEVLLLSLPNHPSARGLTPSILGIERSLWLARAWGAQGAWHFSRAVIQKIHPSEILTLESRILAASLSLIHAEYPNVLKELPSLSELKVLSESWRWQAALIRLQVETLIGDYATALRSLLDLKEKEPLLTERNAIHIDALEAYFIGNSQGPEQGLKKLERIFQSHPLLAQTHPRIYTVTQGVAGDLYSKNGEKSLGKSCFLRALHATARESTVRQPHSELNFLIQLQLHGHGTPKLEKRLLCYPELPPNLEKRISPLRKLPPHSDPVQGARHSPQAEYRVNLKNRECIWQGKRRAETPKEILLAALLLAADRNGLAIPHAYALLWPEEPWNWFQFSERLAKLIQRLRKTYGIPVQRTRNTLRLRDLLLLSPRIEIDRGDSTLPSFFMRSGGTDPSSQNFKSSDVAEFYGLSRRHSINLLQSWLEQGLINKQGAGPASVYVLNPEVLSNEHI